MKYLLYHNLMSITFSCFLSYHRIHFNFLWQLQRSPVVVEMLTEKVMSGIHHSSSLPSSPTSQSSSSASLLLPPPSAPSLDSFLIKSQANGISKSRSNSSSSSSSTTSSRAHRTDSNTKSHTTPDPHHNDGAGHTGSKGDSSRHQTENTLAQLAVTCLRFNVEVLARARASGCVHAVSLLFIHLSLLPSFLPFFLHVY
jgi:hypothetical protein